jgi:segregation and condensation protein B
LTDSVNDLNDSIQVDESDIRISGVMDNESSAAIEALLFASPVPLTEAQLGRLIGRDKKKVPLIIDSLNARYFEWGRSFRIERFGDSYRLYTLPQYDKYISRLAEIPRPARLSRAALEVLSIVAYRQPVVKAEIEKIRGIDSDGVIRTLIEKDLLFISGKSDGPGRPLLYKTSQQFLEFFGISDLSQLPKPEIPITENEPVKVITLIRPPENPESDSLDAAQ